MKSFLEFLVEMSLDDAMKLFGIKEIPSNKEDLNKHFKKLALKHHPDLGGSEETMKLLNQAKELLDKNLGRSSYSKNSNWKQEQDYQMAYVKDLVDKTFAKLDEKIYSTYLEEIFGVPFTHSKKIDYYLKMFKRMTVEFADKERDKIFQLTFMVNELQLSGKIFNKQSLSSSEKSFDVSIQSFVYVDGKKQVLIKEKFYSSNDPKIFTNPSILFPKTKLNKLAKGELRKNSKISKRDFEAMVEGKFKGEVSNVGGGQSYYYIPVHNEEFIVVIWRHTFMRLGYYTLHAIGKPLDKNKKYVFTKYQKWLEFKELQQKYHGYGSTTHFLENQKGFDFLRDALTTLNKSGNIDKFVNDYIEFSKHIYDE